MTARLLRIAMTALCVMATRNAFAQDPVPPPPSRPAPAPAAISGTALKLPNGDPAAGATVKVLDEPFGEAPPGARTKMTTAAQDGSFLFDNLEPGNYWIVANLPGFMPTEYGQRSPTGQGTSIAVKPGQRVTGVRLTMAPTSTISGRVFGEDGEPAGRVQVLALRIIYRDGQPAMTIAQSVMTNDRGEYRLFWLPPALYRVAAKPWNEASVVLPNGSLTLAAGLGEFRVNISPLLNLAGAYRAPVRTAVPAGLQNAYVKSIRLGSADVLNGGLHLDRQPDAPLEIAIGTTPGALDGVVINERREPVANVSVALLPDVARRARTDLYKSISSDASGRFRIAGLPPGDYVAFAFDGAEESEWRNPEFVAPYESRGKPVRIGDGTSSSIELTALAPAR